MNGQITNIKSESIPLKNNFDFKRKILAETVPDFKPPINEMNNNIINPNYEEEKKFQCLTCSIMFSKSTDLTRHYSR